MTNGVLVEKLSGRKYFPKNIVMLMYFSLVSCWFSCSISDLPPKAVLSVEDLLSAKFKAVSTLLKLLLDTIENPLHPSVVM